MAGKISVENGKKGGRPKGKKNKKTLEQKEALTQFQERVRKSIDPLFDAQFNLAHGCSYLYRVDEEWEGKVKKRKHVLVTDPEEIREALDAIDEGDFEEGYYYITTEKPENNAIRDMLDRTFGKPKQSMEVEGSMNHKLSLDDISALVAHLPKEQQRTFYDILTTALQPGKVPGGSGKVKSKPAQ